MKTERFQFPDLIPLIKKKDCFIFDFEIYLFFRFTEISMVAIYFYIKKAFFNSILGRTLQKNEV